MSTYYKSLTHGVSETRTYPEGRMILAFLITELLPSAPINTISNSLTVVAALIVLTVQVGGEARVEPPARVVVECTVTRI